MSAALASDAEPGSPAGLSDPLPTLEAAALIPAFFLADERRVVVIHGIVNERVFAPYLKVRQLLFSSCEYERNLACTMLTRDNLSFKEYWNTTLERLKGGDTLEDLVLAFKELCALVKLRPEWRSELTKELLFFSTPYYQCGLRANSAQVMAAGERFLHGAFQLVALFSPGDWLALEEGAGFEAVSIILGVVSAVMRVSLAHVHTASPLEQSNFAKALDVFIRGAERRLRMVDSITGIFLDTLKRFHHVVASPK